MKRILHLREHGYFAALDSELARVLSRLARESDPDVLLGAALASRMVRDGDVCVDLEALADAPIVGEDGEPISDLAFPALGAWREKLLRSSLVSDGSRATPLVLDARSRLYLARYHQHETRLASRTLELASDAPKPASPLGPALARLFGPASPTPDAQRQAAMVSVLRRLSVVSGGPGTGKTTTVVKILALLAQAGPVRARLLAPTGKAAQRLSDAVRRGKAELAVADDIRARILDEASTIHRALGLATRSPRGIDNPLPADVVVVDESSMVDLPLMRRLLDAIPSSARIVLLGDAHQLASVEAGAVFGDIVEAGAAAGVSPELSRRALDVFGEALPESTDPSRALSDSVTTLQKSYRFDDASGIGGLARAIHEGAPDEALALCKSSSDIDLVELSPAELEQRLARLFLARYSALVQVQSPAAAWAELDRFRLLTAHRKGPFGVERLNLLCERALADAGLLNPDVGRFYPGRPVLVTRNDYQLGLYNGDVGIVLGSDSDTRVYFPRPEGGERVLVPSRLPEHETVFAMSIHKSQGSEFDEVAVVLPEPKSVLLTRELCYTAITRAKKRVELYGQAASLVTGISRRTRRASGLCDALLADNS
jgi:exodeoxyribonuclease V alpha subunit